MDELKKSAPSAADGSSEVHAAVPNEGNVTPGTTPSAANLTENELEDVVGGMVFGGNSSANVTTSGSNLKSFGVTGNSTVAATGGNNYR